MAQQTFDDDFRYALYTVHDEKCIYCVNPLTLDNMEVDHVIPESKLGDSSVLTFYELPSTFDIRGNENLAPAHSKCNGQKSAMLLDVMAVKFVLNRIARRLAALKDAYHAAAKGRGLALTISNISRSVKKGNFTKAELKDALEKENLLGFLTVSQPATPHTRPSIMFSQAATEDIRAANVNAEFVLLALETAILSKPVRIHFHKETGHEIYSIRARNDWQILYTLKDGTDVVVILGLTQRRLLHWSQLNEV